MEVKRICQWCGKPFMAKKTTTNYCSPQCSKRGYKHRMKERRMEMREFQEMLEVKSKLESQEYFTFSQAARLMGVSRQYVYKLVKEDKLRASRLSSRMSLIRRTDIELMLKTKPYEVLRPKDEFDVTEYYTAEQIAELQKITTVLNATIDRAENLAIGINNSVKELQEKKIGAQVHPQTLKSLNEICTNFVVEVGRQLMEHRDKQLELQKEHEKRLTQMLERDQGIWLSDKWMKVLFTAIILYVAVSFVYILCKM